MCFLFHLRFGIIRFSDGTNLTMGTLSRLMCTQRRCGNQTYSFTTSKLGCYIDLFSILLFRFVFLVLRDSLPVLAHLCSVSYLFVHFLVCFLYCLSCLPCLAYLSRTACLECRVCLFCLFCLSVLSVHLFGFVYLVSQSV